MQLVSGEFTPDSTINFMNMRHWLPITLLALGEACRTAFAQPTSPIISSVAFTGYRVDVTAVAGRPYRVTTRLRADTTGDRQAYARLLVSVFKPGRQWSSYIFSPDSVVAPAWQPVTVRGQIGKHDSLLVVMVQTVGNGTFGADDVTLEVEQLKGQWQPIPLANGNFEQLPPAVGPAAVAVADTTTALPPGWQMSCQVVGVGARLAHEPCGNAYLEIRSQGTVRFGQNPRAGHFQTANGVRLYYESYGQGPPLLLLHGNGESISSFGSQIQALAEHYRVLAVDTRGHGRSGNPRQRYTYDLFADDMVALLDSLRLPAAHVVGWSDGGNTGLSMALRYSSRVLTLTTMGANLYADRTAVVPGTLGELRLLRLVAVPASVFSSKMRRVRRLSGLLLHYPRMKPADLAAVRAPTLVLAGEKDVIQPAHTRLIAASIVGAECVILPGLTHYAPQEDGPRFNRVVLDFLAHHPLSAAQPALAPVPAR